LFWIKYCKKFNIPFFTQNWTQWQWFNPKTIDSNTRIKCAVWLSIVKVPAAISLAIKESGSKKMLLPGRNRLLSLHSIRFVKDRIAHWSLLLLAYCARLTFSQFFVFQQTLVHFFVWLTSIHKGITSILLLFFSWKFQYWWNVYWVLCLNC